MMDKKVVFLVLVIFSLGLVSGHSVYHDVDGDYVYKEKIVESSYYPREHRVYSRTTYVDYDNDERFSTYDYRHGYSYRASVDYRDRHYSVWDYGRDEKDYYYEYVSYLRKYEKRECYHEAPKGKLFYIKC